MNTVFRSATHTEVYVHMISLAQYMIIKIRIDQRKQIWKQYAHFVEAFL